MQTDRNSIKNSSGVSASALWEQLAVLRRRMKKPAQLLAYMHLFELAGHRPGTVRFTRQELAAEFGCEPRTADGWIDGLLEVGLIEVGWRDRGTFDAYVHSPTAIDQPKRLAADPQREMQFEENNARESAQIPPGVSACKPPIADDIQQTQTFAPSTIRLPNRFSDQGVSAQQSPVSPMETMEPSCSMVDGSGKLPLSIVSMEGEFDIDELNRRRQIESRQIEKQLPKHVGRAMVEAVNRFADNSHPEKLKADLIALIESRGYPRLDRVIAARAAEAVVFDGLDRKILSRILDNVDRGWKAGKINNPGAVFQHRMRDACDKAKVKWRDGKSEDRR